MTDESGERIGVVLDIEEYERLREVEDASEDAEASQAVQANKAAIGRGEEEVIPWDQAVREIRKGKVIDD